MKKIKGIVLSLAFMGTIPFLAGCNEPQIVIQTLAAPTGISSSQDVISWQAVENADFYEVQINGKTYRTDNPNISVANILSQSGEYEVFVVAYSNSALFLKSETSAVFKYDTRQTLSAPTNFAINKETKVLSWTMVDGVQNYVLTINGSPIVLNNKNYRVVNGRILVDLNNYQQYIFDGYENKFSVCCSGTTEYKASEQTQVLTLVIKAEQAQIENVKVTKYGKKVYLTFDELSTATNGYTYCVDGGDEVLIDGSGADISSYVNANSQTIENFEEFGEYEISVYANQVLTQNGECIFEQSATSTATFENTPNFVGQQVDDVSVSKQTLSFVGFEDASEYKIKISKTLFDQTDVLAELDVPQQYLLAHGNQIDISHYTQQVGKYLFEIYATQSGKDGQTYQSETAVNNSLKVATILDTPTLSVQNYGPEIMITVDNIVNASSVLVYLNDNVTPILNLTQFANGSVQQTISKSLLADGDNQFFCKAVGDRDLFFDSPYSAYETYKIAKINIPTSLKISESGVLSYAYSGDFDKFLIYVNGIQVGESTTFIYDLNITRAGKYSIYVTASYKGSEGEASKQVQYLKTEKLSTPSNVRVASKILTFDSVPNATSYNVYITNSSHNDYLVFSKVILTRLTLPDSVLASGNNQIKVLANGDGEIYFTSDYSVPYTFKLTDSIDGVTGIAGEVQNEKYVLTFDGVNRASKYVVDIKTPSQKTYSVESTQTSIDIDRYMTELGEYTFDVTAVSNNPDYSNSLTTKKINFDVLYNKLYYQTNNFFYDGHQYPLVFSSEYSIQDYVLYAVLYGIDELHVYIDNSKSAFDLENKTLKSYLPCLSNFGVDFSNGNDLSAALMPLLLSFNTTKIANAMRLIERAHDQLYLYYDIDESATRQSNSSKNPNVYTIKINYQNGFTINPTNNHNKPLAEKYDVIERTDFAIDNLTKTAPVETVAQLLMVVQNGRKPEFTKPDTVAELTYEYAKNVLSKICNNSMTDAEKAVAIHDWIVVNNKYANDTYESASGEPFSVDNLNDMAFFASGTILYHYSVCSGYAQTFALMCCIEGIEVTTTFGLCGGGIDYTRVNFDESHVFSTLLYLGSNQDKLANIGAHSWNRVKLDIGNGKKWYIVDATWDDPDSTSKPLAVEHTYMFVTDDFVKDNRKEFFPNGDLYHRTDSNGDVINYAATDTKNYYQYAGAVASSQIELVAIMQKLATNDSVVVAYSESLSQSTITNAITSAGLNANNYAVFIYDSKYAYIYKK